MVAKGKTVKRAKPVDEAVTPSKKVKKEVKAEEPKVEKKSEKKIKGEAKAESVETPKKKEKKQQNKVSAEPPAKKEKKSEEAKVESVKQEQTEKKNKKKNKKMTKASVPAAKVEEAKAEEVDAYIPGALSALFGSGGGEEVAATETKPDIFAKYADVDNGFVDVPTVIGAVGKKEDKTAENSRKKQRENRKKNPDDRELVDERKRTVFVGNLPVEYTRKKLEALFAPCGKIDSVRLRGTVGSKETLSKKTAFLSGKLNENIACIMGYVKFASADTVAEAMKKNGTVVDGHHIHVDGCVDIKNYDRKVTIFVGNLPFEIRDDELIEWAEECVGKVDFVRVVRDKNTGYGKGVGFIRFKDHSSIEKALSLTNPVVGGNEIRLQKVMKKHEKKDLRKGDARRTALRKQKKLDKKAGLRGKPQQQQQQHRGVAGAANKMPVNPLNPLMPKPARPSRKVQKEIMKRKKMSGPKSLMK